ncbi:MAG: sigma-70 family RNA polymerase sigma factor [Betaproteobacteria bacterium]
MTASPAHTAADPVRTVAGPAEATAGPSACAANAWLEHQSELKGYLIHRLADPALAEDLLQETFLRALRQGEAFCALDNPRAWLFQVARNAVADHLRLAKANVPLPDDLADEAPVIAPVDALAECMEQVLSELPEADRDLLRRCDLEGMKLQDYADAHGLGLPAVKSRIQRTRQRMRDTLTRRCQVRFDDVGQVCCHRPRTAAQPS